MRLNLPLPVVARHGNGFAFPEGEPPAFFRLPQRLGLGNGVTRSALEERSARSGTRGRTRRRAKKASNCATVVGRSLWVPAACAARSAAASSRIVRTSGARGLISVALRGRCCAACCGIALRAAVALSIWTMSASCTERRHRTGTQCAPGRRCQGQSTRGAGLHSASERRRWEAPRANGRVARQRTEGVSIEVQSASRLMKCEVDISRIALHDAEATQPEVGTVVALDSGERRTVQGRSGDGRGDSQGGLMGDGRAIRGAGRKARSTVSCGSGGGERARSNGVMPDGRGGHGLASSSRHQ